MDGCKVKQAGKKCECVMLVGVKNIVPLGIYMKKQNNYKKISIRVMFLGWAHLFDNLCWNLLGRAVWDKFDIYIIAFYFDVFIIKAWEKNDKKLKQHKCSRL